ncbi:DNA-3-methyladenine glycosylase 2 family protein [bacterium]|nr:DNA-3-methyladenine glycosylase 2 family protein [bacterium]
MKNPKIQVFPGSLRAARHLQKVDPHFAPVIRQVGRMRVELDPEETVFESLAVSILYQQLHGKAAAAIQDRFQKLFSKPDSFPTPKKILTMAPARMRAAGLSEAKVAAILDLANRTLAREIPDRKTAEGMSNEELIEACTAVRGIGPWTAQMMLIFTLARMDVLPTADYGVRKGLAMLYGMMKLPTAKQLAEIGARWAPYRSVASWYLWRVTELDSFSSGASFEY